MNNKRVDSDLKRAIENITPDIYENIISVPVSKMKAHDHITMQTTSTVKRSFSFQIATVFVLFVMVIGFFIGWSQIFQVYGVVDLDVNPSIELNLNRQNRVIKANAINLDGTLILSNLSLRHVKLENAIDAILASMTQKGYLNSSADTILVTVLMNEDHKAQELEKRVLIRIDQYFNTQSVPKIYSQSLRNQPALKTPASNYQISRGMMNLVQTVLLHNPQYTIEELLNLPIKQLYQLAYGNGSDNDNDDFDDDDRLENKHKDQGTIPFVPLFDDDDQDDDDQDDFDEDDSEDHDDLDDDDDDDLDDDDDDDDDDLDDDEDDDDND